MDDVAQLIAQERNNEFLSEAEEGRLLRRLLGSDRPSGRPGPRRPIAFRQRR